MKTTVIVDYKETVNGELVKEEIQAKNFETKREAEMFIDWFRENRGFFTHDNKEPVQIAYYASWIGAGNALSYIDRRVSKGAVYKAFEEIS